jgi:AraC-like DNA-binding protein
MERAVGFDNQRLCVVPRPMVAEALARPVTRRLVVTDAGYFPHAVAHGRHRPHGAAETIVIVCVAGSGWVEVEGTRVRVGSSTAIVIPGGLPHAYGASGTDPWTIWWCHVRGSDVPELVEAAGIRPAGAQASDADGSGAPASGAPGSGAPAPGAGASRSTVSLRAVDRITAMLDEIVASLERDQSPARLLATAGMAWRMLTQLAVDRRLPEQGEPLERALRYLEERVDGAIRVPELAALVGVSSSHLSALFREATGGGVLAHHTALKMACARRLLDTTTLSVAEVGREVGMADQFYFSRQFRRTHGVSPSAYRSHRKG